MEKKVLFEKNVFSGQKLDLAKKKFFFSQNVPKILPNFAKNLTFSVIFCHFFICMEISFFWKIPIRNGVFFNFMNFSFLYRIQVKNAKIQKSKKSKFWVHFENVPKKMTLNVHFFRKKASFIFDLDSV